MNDLIASSLTSSLTTPPRDPSSRSGSTGRSKTDRYGAKRDRELVRRHSQGDRVPHKALVYNRWSFILHKTFSFHTLLDHNIFKTFLTSNTIVERPITSFQPLDLTPAFWSIRRRPQYFEKISHFKHYCWKTYNLFPTSIRRTCVNFFPSSPNIIEVSRLVPSPLCTLLISTSKREIGVLRGLGCEVSVITVRILQR
jgi:hypothetical protein